MINHRVEAFVYITLEGLGIYMALPVHRLIWYALQNVACAHYLNDLRPTNRKGIEADLRQLQPFSTQ